MNSKFYPVCTTPIFMGLDFCLTWECDRKRIPCLSVSSTSVGVGPVAGSDIDCTFCYAASLGP